MILYMGKKIFSRPTKDYWVRSREVSSMHSAPAFPGLYITMWSIFNIAVIIMLILMIMRYFRNKNVYRQQVINKLDSILTLLQQDKSNDK